MKTFKEDTTSIDVYLKEISKIPLLTPQEEMATATRLKDLRECLEAKIAAKASAKVIEDLKAQHDHVKAKMIRSNCRLVVSIARRYQNQHLHLSDLIEEGNIGLMRAVERFDPTKGFRFSTFAIWWIKQSIIKALKEKGSMIRIPMHISKEVSRYARWVSEFKNQHGREPDLDDIANGSHVDRARVDLLASIPRDFISTNETHGTSERELGELLPDEDENNQPSNEAVKHSLADAIHKLMDHLSEKEARILKMRYGLDNNEPMVLDSIGRHMGITRERVRQIQASALKKMRRIGVAEELNLFLE